MHRSKLPGVPLRATQREPIAVVGAACRFPGAQDLDAFNAAIVGPIEVVRSFPERKSS